LIPRAIELYREATIAARSFAPAWRGLGVANERIGRRAEALDAYDQYLALAGAAADAGSVRRRIERLKARSDRH